MTTFYCCSDAEQFEIEADSFEEVIEQVDIPGQELIDDGAFLVIRNEETMETREWGNRGN